MATVPDELIVLSARFVIHDQWLTTRISHSWNILQLKSWLLSKCLHVPLPSDFDSVLDPQLPRRPPSPITFAPNAHNRPVSPIRFAPISHVSASDSSEDEHEQGYEEDDESDPADPQMAALFPKSPPKRKRRTTHQQPVGPSPSSYVLLRFSTGQILEDDFTVDWYSIRALELLEIHPIDIFVKLPRHTISEYCSPFFHAKVRLLRVLEGKLHFQDQGLTDDFDPESTRIMIGPRPERIVDKHYKTRFDWRDRWLVIKDGVLHVCKSETCPPTQSLQLTALLELHGPDHLQELESSASRASLRVICAKFSEVNHIPPKRKLSKKASFQNPSGVPVIPIRLVLPNASSDTPAKNIFADESRSTLSMNRLSRTLSKRRVSARSEERHRHPSPESRLKENENHSREALSDISGGSSPYSSPIFAHSVKGSDEDEEDWGLPYVPMRSQLKQPPAALNSGSEKKAAAPQVRVVGRDRTQWLVFETVDESSYTSLLRILHRHAGTALKSSFLSTLAPLAKTSMGSKSNTIIHRASTTESEGTSVSHHSDTVWQPNLLHPASLTAAPSKVMINTFGALPYPEWRHATVEKALVSGWGAVTRATQSLLLDQYGLEPRIDVVHNHPSTSSLLSSQSSTTTTTAHTVQTSLEGETAFEDFDTQLDLSGVDIGNGTGDDEEPCLSEWVGWMADLPRQTRTVSSPLIAEKFDPNEADDFVRRFAYEPTGMVSLSSTLTHHKSMSSMPHPSASSSRHTSPFLEVHPESRSSSISSTWNSLNRSHLPRRASITSTSTFVDPTQQRIGSNESRQSLESPSSWQPHLTSVAAASATGMRRLSSPTTSIPIEMSHSYPNASGTSSDIPDAFPSLKETPELHRQRSFATHNSITRKTLHGRSSSISTTQASVRRVKSGSHIDPMETTSIISASSAGSGGSPSRSLSPGAQTKKAKAGLKKGFTMRAAQFVRGLDAALDFVDDSEYPNQTEQQQHK